MNQQIVQKIQEEIDACEKFISSEFVSRDGNYNDPKNKAELQVKIKILEAYIPRIQNKDLLEKCLGVIRLGKPYI